MTHAWCRDIARDAAVRTAEAIARPFADAAKCSVPVSKTGEGQSGLRTERLTLDITSAHDERLADCIVESIGDCLLHGESVRVVDEDREAADRVSREEGYRVLLAEVMAAREERDSAIRERDCEKQRADRDSVKCSALADKVISLRARVAELEARTLTPGEGSCAAQAASGGGDHFADASKMVEQPRGWLTEEEIDAVADAADTLSLRGCGSERRARILRELLARSTPPEVMLESWREAAGEVVSLDDVRAALAEIGVAVKEVGRA